MQSLCKIIKRATNIHHVTIIKMLLHLHIIKLMSSTLVNLFLTFQNQNSSLIMQLKPALYMLAFYMHPTVSFIVS